MKDRSINRSYKPDTNKQITLDKCRTFFGLKDKQRIIRKCLNCEEEFVASGRFNRLCEHCK